MTSPELSLNEQLISLARALRDGGTKSVGCDEPETGIKAGLDPSVASPRINQYETGKHVPDIQPRKLK